MCLHACICNTCARDGLCTDSFVLREGMCSDSFVLREDTHVFERGNMFCEFHARVASVLKPVICLCGVVVVVRDGEDGS